MVIDINNGITPGGSSRERANGVSATNPEARNQAKAQEQTRERAPDEVSLSQEARSMNALRNRIDDLPDVDEDKVAAIRQAISEGRFEINAERIAENLLRQDELLG